MKQRNIPRSRFETCGFRSIELSRGQVKWPDGTVCRFNVRLVASQGSEGDVMLIAEDINKPSDRSTKTITLRRKK